MGETPSMLMGLSIMHRKLFVLAFVVFMSVGTGCTPPSTPSALQRTGIKGTTRSIVISGVPGGPTIGGPASVEFAVAPVEAGKPVFDKDKVIFVKSDAQGMFEVERPPGAYWIGPKAKALDPVKYVQGDVVFSEMVVVVKEGTFISVELVQTGYAP